ncbi:hypothetical protein PIB30_105360, partial [Stylosanthes scabra]|nr:hypothetical protein [Stylosanthes scabra]
MSSVSTDTLAEILGAIKDLTDTVRCQSESNKEFLEQIKNGHQNGESSDANAKKPPVNPNYRRLSEFKKNTPSSFHGEYDPVIAQRWIEKLEKIFDAMDCLDSQR